MKVSYLVAQLLVRLIEFEIWLVVLLRRCMMLNLMKLSQEEYENLDDVRGTQLVNAMKNKDICDIRPREVIEVKDDKDQVLSNSNVQVDTNQASSSSQVQNQQVVSTSSQPNDQ